jgi:hypothetical protein
MDENKKLGEEQLESVAGGLSENRYDPNVCNNTLGRTRYECVGLGKLCWCDHYRKVDTRKTNMRGARIYQHDCAMGAFSYEGFEGGAPRE